MNLSAIYSKTGKGVQEASGKTSRLSRADRAVLSAIDGKTPLTDVLTKFEKLTAPKFEALIEQLDKDGYIREVSSGSSQSSAPVSRTVPPPRGAPPPKAPAPSGDDDEVLDFTQAIMPSKGPAAAPPKGPTLDLAAASRAEAERRAKEQEAFDYKARAEAEARAKAEAEAKARAAAAESRARLAAEEKARAEAEARAGAEAEAKTRAEADAKVKAAREAAIRLATEAKAKGEAAEERARKEAEEKARLEAELNAKLAEERKAREEAERRAQEAAERARQELEEKAKRDAEELRQRLEAEMKAKLEEERKAREAEDRKRREEEDRKRREEDERRRKEEQERRAKEEAERKAREAEDRKRREEEDRKRREEDERRRKEDEERRAKEEAERRARREEEERRAKEDAERRKREDAERKARDEAERREKDEAEAKARAAQSASLPAIDTAAATAPPAAAAPSGAGGIGDSLLADLDSFSAREEEETRAKEEAERKAKEAAARRAKEETGRKAKEEADRKRREEEDRRRKDEEERRAREEAEREEREEEERRKEEEAERKRQAKEALAAKKAEQSGSHAAMAKAGPKGEDDIEVTDEDLDMDDIKREQKVLATTARKVEREFEPPPPAAVSVARRPKKWGKPAAIALFVLLVGGLGLLNVMPVSTADYEKAASEAIGAPVKIGSARLSVLAGIQVKFENVSIGDGAKIRLVRGSPEIGSLFGGRKAFSRIELEGASITQAQLGEAVFGKVSGDNFRVGRIVMKQAKFEGPLVLPALDVEAVASSDGTLQSVSMQGGDKLSVQISPKGSEAGFEISAASLAMPFVPAVTLLEFGMKGTANRDGVTASEFDGRLFDGVVSGKAKIRWGANWNVEGDLRARSMKVAVFAPALVSEGRVEADGSFSMSGPVPASLFESARVQGNFKIEKGVLGSFDLTRALKTGGAQTSGSTSFSELTGQALYEKGVIQLRNIAITSGGMNAGASLDIDAGGGLAGRVVADVKTPTQSLRATLNISGKVQDPVIRK